MDFKPDWPETKEAFKGWWNREGDVPLVQVQTPRADAPEFRGFDSWGFAKPGADPDRVLDEFLASCATTRFLGEAFPALWLNLGPGLLAAHFTGYMHYSDEVKTVWFEKPMGWTEVEQLEFQEHGEAWQYTKRIAQVAAERSDGRYIVGMTDIGGNLDVLASFRGTNELLTDMVMEPGRVEAILEKIDREWFRVYNELDAIIRPHQEGTCAWMGLWAPGTWYPLQCDFAAMISPDMFQGVVVPSLQRLCDGLDYTIFHLDGPRQICHLDHLLDMEDLDGIQWVPGSGAAQCESTEWLDLYRRVLEQDKLLVLQCISDYGKIPALLDQLPNHGRIALIGGFATEAEGQRFLKSIPGR